MTLQQEIIRELGVVPTIDAKAEIRNSIEFLKAYLQKIPFENSCFRDQRWTRFNTGWSIGSVDNGRNAQ